MNYLLKKIKPNVYALRIVNEDNLIINKILKISINAEEYLNEYNIYKELLVENKNYNIENISNYLKYENINKFSNIDIIFNDNIKINIPVLDLLSEEYDEIILNLYILYGNYIPNNKTLNNYLSSDDLDIIVTLINNALINRRNASNTKNLKHCDFKTNNILVDNKMNIYLFDFDFSIILKADETITISENDKINLYLNVKKGHKISGMFLDLFDIYLLALSIILYYNTKNIKLIKIHNYFEISLLSNKELCDDFFVFYIIFSNLLLKLPKKIYYYIYLSYTTYNMIYNILQNLVIEFSSSTHKLFANKQYQDAIQYIKKIIYIS